MSHLTFVPALGRTQVQIAITPAAPPPDPATDAAIEHRWATLTAANPRLFDGPILTVQSIHLPSGIISCRRDSYKRLAVQPQIPTGVTLLSVSGIITACDTRGLDHVLLGQRAAETRIYGNMWEFAPSGGIDPPPTGKQSIDWSGIIARLEAELRSESGLDSPILDARLFGLFHDPAAASTDLVIRGRLAVAPRPMPRTNWEYRDLRWVPLPEAPAFTQSRPSIAMAMQLASMLA